MAHKIRFILDVETHVMRDIAIEKEASLEDLHHAVTKAFGFGGNEMASYFKTDDEWNQGEEIPLFDMSDAGFAPTMQSTSIESIIPEKGHKLIYVYDFMNLWTFFVEVLDVSFASETTPYIVTSLGEIPEQAPEKKFEAEFSMPEDDDLFGQDDIFDNIDDIDLDNF